MRLPPGIRRLLRLPAGHRPIDREIDDELTFHFDATIAELRAMGLTPDEARREAARRFGNITDVRRHLHRIDSTNERRELRQDRLDAFKHDLRSAVRSLITDRRVALFIICTLMLGIGANATMFSIVDRLLLRPPPHVSDDPLLTRLYVRRLSPDFGVFYGTSTSYPAYAALRDESGAFSDAAAAFGAQASLGRGLDATKINVQLATANLFDLLGVRPALGRFFSADEDRASNNKPPVVISHGLWARQFGSDAQILGRELHINQKFYAVVGVAPRGFNATQLNRVDAWIPMHVAAAEYTDPTYETLQDMRWLSITAKRRPEVSVDAAAARASETYQRNQRAGRKSDSTASIVLGSMVPARGIEGVAGMLTSKSGSGSLSARVAAWLGIVAAIVLAIACANVANLLLLRAAARRREIAVRLALGISRWRLATQLLLESTILATLGGVAALALVPVVTKLLRATLLGSAEVAAGQIDTRLIGFTIACVALVGVMSGLAPLLLSRRMELSDALKAGVREGSVRRSRLRTGLLVMQGALSVLLLVGAGLFLRSLNNVSQLDLGFDPDRVMIASVDISEIASNTAVFEDFWKRALERVQSLNSVQHAALSVTTPLESGWTLDVAVDGRDSLPPLLNGPFFNAVTPDYFVTLGARMLRGRGFAASDQLGSAPVAIVNEAMAQYLWPGEEALGKCYYVVTQERGKARERSSCMTVVGIVQNSRANEFRSSGTPEHFVPQAQQASLMKWRVVMVRARDGVPATTTQSDVKRALQDMDSRLPFADVRFLREPLSLETRPWELGATMFALFGSLALLIAAVGLYSTVAYEITQRTHEFGIRQALGAGRGHVTRLVVWRAVRYIVPGLVVGLGLAFLATRWVRPLLFDVSPRDPLVYSTVILTLMGAALLAAFGPARRALKSDPVTALREE